MDFDTIRSRRLAEISKDARSLANTLLKACDEIDLLRARLAEAEKERAKSRQRNPEVGEE